jgi:hypothetical protein
MPIPQAAAPIATRLWAEYDRTDKKTPPRK